MALDVERQARREEIVRELLVAPSFDADAEIERRVGFLVGKLEQTGAAGYVLGISGGVDSATAGRLCQLAVERRRAGGHEAIFVAMRLPYGEQFDEDDAQRALAFVRPDRTLTVDVRPATDALVDAVDAGGDPLPRLFGEHYVGGNVKARERMVAQYAVAGAHGLLVVGTDHAAEAVTGFFTKYGDGACDLIPLAGLTKRRVRALATTLGAEPQLVQKVPTADLESDRPGLPDEQALGLAYDEIDDFLEGRPVEPHVHDLIVAIYDRTGHKRALPEPPPPA